MMLSIFDERVVIFGPQPEDVRGDIRGVLVSADDEVVDWAIEVYERYRVQSRSPSDHFVYELLSKLDTKPRLKGLLSD